MAAAAALLLGVGRAESTAATPAGGASAAAVEHTVATAGFVCKGTMMLYPDGSVAECRSLAEPMSRGEQAFAADARVCFDPRGSVIDCSTSHQCLEAFPD